MKIKGFFKKAFNKKNTRKSGARSPTNETDVETGGAADKSVLMEDNKSDGTESRFPKIRIGASKKKKEKKQRGIVTGIYNYMDELKMNEFYSIREVTGQYIDVVSTFSPKPKWWMVVMKLMLSCVVSFLITVEVYRSVPLVAFLATFDHWAMTASFVYLWISFATNALRQSSQSVDISNKKNLLELPHKVMWTLFAVAAPSQLFETLAFWIFQYKASDQDLKGSLLLHGGITLILLYEGLVLNRIPIRIKHQWFFLGFMFAFLVWSLLHSIFKLNNPEYYASGDGSLYPFLKWNHAPLWTTMYATIVQFLVAPLLYYILWRVSIYSWPWKFEGTFRRFLTEEESGIMESYVAMSDDEKTQNTAGSIDKEKQRSSKTTQEAKTTI